MIGKAQFLREQLEKPSEDSKKWRMTIIGLKGLAGAFIVGMIMIILKETQAAHITTMVQIFMTAWGGVVGIYLGAQGSVEFKTTSALQTVQETQTREEHKTIEVHHVIEEGAPGAPEFRPWRPLAKDE